MPHSPHFRDEKIEAYRTSKWARVSSHGGCLTHRWTHSPPLLVGEVFEITVGSSSLLACSLFRVKGANQCPLNCDVPIVSPGISLKCRFWCRRCGVGPEILDFQQAFQMLWSRDPTLSSNIIHIPIAYFSLFSHSLIQNVLWLLSTYSVPGTVLGAGGAAMDS